MESCGGNLFRTTEATAQVFVQTGYMRFEFGHRHIERNVDPGNAEPGRIVSESSAKIYESTFVSGFFSCLHFSIGYRVSPAEGIRNCPHRYAQSFLEVPTAL